MNLSLCTRKRSLVIILFVIFFSKVCASEIIISDFPFGGKLKTADAATKITSFNEFSPGWDSYYFDEDGFFDFSEALTDDDLTIHSLSFEKQYEITVYNLAVIRDRIKDDFEQLKKALEDKYGYFETENATGILGDESEQNLFWLSAIEQFLVLDTPIDNIGQIRISISAPPFDLEKPDAKRKISLSLMYFDPLVVEMLKDRGLKRFSDF